MCAHLPRYPYLLCFCLALLIFENKSISVKYFNPGCRKTKTKSVSYPRKLHSLGPSSSGVKRHWNKTHRTVSCTKLWKPRESGWTARVPNKIRRWLVQLSPCDAPCYCQRSSCLNPTIDWRLATRSLSDCSVGRTQNACGHYVATLRLSRSYVKLCPPAWESRFVSVRRTDMPAKLVRRSPPNGRMSSWCFVKCRGSTYHGRLSLFREIVPGN